VSQADPRIRVWDRPTRLFHWLLVALIAAAWWTGENEDLTWHYRIGMIVLMLVLFRLIWGLIGGSTARFVRFVRGPRAIAAYLRGTAPPAVGHNPLGALSVLALLGLVSLVLVLGLFATDDDGLDPGPLAHLVSYEAAEQAQELHEVAFDLLLVVIAIHVAAIFYYLLFKRDNLIGPMLTGSRRGPEGAEPLRPAPLWRTLFAIIAATSIGWWIWSGF
jgi:cytochrome b